MTYVVQYTIPYFTGVPTDAITNTWHFDYDNGGIKAGPAQCQALVGVIKGFYQNIFAGSPGTMALWTDPLKASAKVYDLDDPMPRVAIWEGPSPTTVIKDASSSHQSPETAICASYRAEFPSGVDKATRRGRIYLGGIGGGCYTLGGASAFPLVIQNFREDVGTFLQTMIGSAAAIDWVWVVYSRKMDSSSPVVAGWVDNAFDTQRRRGQAATARSSWVL